ncbi:hypothetical protein GCM10009528_35940 [Kineococcus aurantiacus]
MTADLAVKALRIALIFWGGTDVLELVVHSDRGARSRSHRYLRALSAGQARGSMGQVGTCADNAAMELFFSLLQKNVLNRRRWPTATSYAWLSSLGSSGPITAAAAGRRWVD